VLDLETGVIVTRERGAQQVAKVSVYLYQLAAGWLAVPELKQKL